MSPVWRNHTRNQRCHPVEIARPGSLEDLVELARGGKCGR